MMARRVTILVVLLSAALISLGTIAQSMQMLRTHYYVLSLGRIAPNIQTIVQTSQADGFSVVLYEDDGAVGYQGVDLATEPIDALLAGDRLVVVDADQFYFRSADESLTYTVRPAANGYDLILNPHQDQMMTDALTSVIAELQAFGLFVTEFNLLDDSGFPKDALKGPAPPQGARMDSDLYWLTVAEDWFAFAAQKALSLTGLRVEVFAETFPTEQVPAEFGEYVVDETEQGAKLLLPVDRLVALASSDSIGYVRQLYRPAVP